MDLSNTAAPSTVGMPAFPGVAGPPYMCDLCGAQSETLPDMQIHMLLHSAPDRLTCPVCNKTFASSTNMRNHLTTHVDHKRFKCRYCDRRFNWRTQLTTHEYTHNGKGLYYCPICSKPCMTKWLLTRHVKVHAKEGNVNIDNIMKNQFERKPDPRKSPEVLSPAYPNSEGSMSPAQPEGATDDLPATEPGYVCTDCGKDFSTKEQMATHVLVHLNNKSHSCRKCHKVYYKLAALRAHSRRNPECGAYNIGGYENFTPTTGLSPAGRTPSPRDFPSPQVFSAPHTPVITESSHKQLIQIAPEGVPEVVQPVFPARASSSSPDVDPDTNPDEGELVIDEGPAPASRKSPSMDIPFEQSIKKERLDDSYAAQNQSITSVLSGFTSTPIASPLMTGTKRAVPADLPAGQYPFPTAHVPAMVSSPLDMSSDSITSKRRRLSSVPSEAAPSADEQDFAMDLSKRSPPVLPSAYEVNTHVPSPSEAATSGSMNEFQLILLHALEGQFGRIMLQLHGQHQQMMTHQATQITQLQRQLEAATEENRALVAKIEKRMDGTDIVLNSLVQPKSQ